MSDLHQIEQRLANIEDMLSALLKQNTPFSLSIHEKGQFLAKAAEESRRTGDRSIFHDATRRINGE